MYGRDADHLISQLGEMTVPKLHTIVMLLSCQKTIGRQEAVRETWLSHGVPEGMKVVFLVGRPGQQAALCGDILYLDCPDTYLALPQKTWAGITECLNRWDFEWLFKADDDSWVNLWRVRHYIKSRDYMGRKVAVNGTFDPNWHDGKCRYSSGTKHRRSAIAAALRSGRQTYPMTTQLGRHTPFIAPWAGGGAGYFLSRRAARLVAREPLSHVLRESYEDKFVGDVMASYGIYLHGEHHSLRGIPQANGRAVSLGNILGATTIHQLMPDQMREVYWRLLRKGEIGT